MKILCFVYVSLRAIYIRKNSLLSFVYIYIKKADFICTVHATYMKQKIDILKTVTGHLIENVIAANFCKRIQGKIF